MYCTMAARAERALVVALLGLALLSHTVSSPSSKGCGTAPPTSPGQTTEHSISDVGTERSFHMHVPVGYDSSQPTAVILAFHGWGGNGQGFVQQMTPQSDYSNFVVVGPNGLAENQRASWNGGGTTQVPYPGPRGPTCDISMSAEYCYSSCAARPEGCHPCDWTTCNNDIAFTTRLLDWLEAQLCVDLARVYVVGFSNGATFTYAVSAALSSRISAFVANSGTPHPGFESAPANVQAAMDIHGVNDDTCPADNASPGLGGTSPGQPSSDGWYYLDVASTLKLWVDVLHDAQTSAGCSLEPPVNPTNPPAYPTSVDGHQGLSCVQLSSHCSDNGSLNRTRVVRCSFVGGHEVHAEMPLIAWEFFSSLHDMSPPPANADPTPQFPTDAVLGGLGVYVTSAVVGVLFCACCTTATIKRDAIRASLARGPMGGSLPFARGRSASNEQPMMPQHSSC